MSAVLCRGFIRRLFGGLRSITELKTGTAFGYSLGEDVDTQKQMPKLLWISIISLVIMMLGNFAAGFFQATYIAIPFGVVDGLLIWGISRGFRWAFWTTTVLVFGGMLYIIMFFGRAQTIIISAVLDFSLFVPVFIQRKYFFLVTDNM